MYLSKVREWFAEVQRRSDMGLDPFQEHTGQSRDGGEGGEEDGEETQGETSTANEDQTGAGGDEDEDEEDEEEDADDTDDSEVWEPSRSVRKSLSVSED